MAARIMMKRCPKCNRKITNRIECRNCGLLFERYKKAQIRKKEEAQAQAAINARVKLVLNGIVILILSSAIIGGIFYYQRTKTVSQVTALDRPETIPVSSRENAKDNTRDEGEAPATRQTAGTATSIEMAQQATVIVSSPWGEGAGFFIRPDTVITSKKLVEYSDSRLENEKKNAEEQQKEIEEAELYLEELQRQYETMPEGADKMKLAADIVRRQERIDEKREKIQNFEQTLTDREASIDDDAAVTVKLADGREFTMSYMVTSDRFDLAALSLFNTDTAPLTISQGMPDQGTKLYTLGEGKLVVPSTFTELAPDPETQEELIRTDAVVYPTHIGGPLVDETGLAYGVSIATPREMGNIGLAVPMFTILAEFNL